MPELDERVLRQTLVQANRTVRADRPPLPVHTNSVMHSYLAATGKSRRQVHMYHIWFRTRGCTYDRAGQCSMCNYGIGPEIDIRRIARSIALRLAEVPAGASIYLSPSGSFLDDLEVPTELREELLHLLAARQPRLFSFEARPETFSADKLDHVRELLPETILIGQVGAESWDPRVRKLCHLKLTPQAAYLKAGQLMRSRGFDSIANITLGGLGLSQREAFEDTVASIRGARAAGYDTLMVFPLSAKSGTLLGWATEQGMWEPPTLWMLIRVLAEITSTDISGGERSDLSVSWFDVDVGDVVQVRPDGCDRCRPLLRRTLHDFRADPRYGTLREALAWRDCPCPAQTDAILSPDADDPGYLSRLAAVAQRWQDVHPGAGHRSLLAEC
jgi:radical SAM enzyme (TIGR01210 family)